MSSELRDRLQESLGAAYIVERELGAGSFSSDVAPAAATLGGTALR
jgi:hypothetical protein